MPVFQAPAHAAFHHWLVPNPEDGQGERAAAERARFHTKLMAYREAKAETRRAEAACDPRGPEAATPGLRSPREFDAAIDLLDLPTSHRRHDEALKAMANALLGLKDAAGPRFVGGARLLCDRQARDRVAFRPATTVDAFLREALAGTLDQTLRDRHDLPLGFGAVVAHDLTPHGPGTLTHAPTPMPSASTRSAVPGEALQRAFLARLFTNAWWSDGSEQRISPRGECWLLGADQAFPDPEHLLKWLPLLQSSLQPTALFNGPKDPPAAWSEPFAPDLVAKVRAIDTKQLQATLCRKLIDLTEQDAPAGTLEEGKEAAQRLFGAVGLAIAAIESVQALFARNPRITPRQLQLTYPAFLDWLDSRPVPGGRPAPWRTRGERQAHDRLVQDLRGCADELEKENAAVHAAPSGTPALLPAAVAPEPVIDDAELFELLRRATPSTRFNPFGCLGRSKPSLRGDRVLAPLLRRAVQLRSTPDGDNTRRSALKLRDAAARALQQAVAGAQRLSPEREDRIKASKHQVNTLIRLIADTEDRHGLGAPSPEEKASPPSRRSWLPWRRGAQRQA